MPRIDPRFLDRQTSTPAHILATLLRSFCAEAIYWEISVKQLSVRIFMALGHDTAVGVATPYGLDGQGIEYRCGRDFPQPSRPALGHTRPL